jgi:DNA polymerase
VTSLHGDFETHSAIDLREVGLYNYARHETTDVWCLAWAFGDEEPQIWFPDLPLPERVRQHIEAGGKFEGWNVGFEHEIWNEICVKRYGFPELRIEQCYDTMARAFAMGMPGALEDCAYAAGVRFLKDTEGRALMMRMTRPRAMHRPNGEKLKAWEPGAVLTWWDEPEKITRLHEYCKQDVRVERAVGERLMPLSEKERRVWLVDFKINRRGVAADIETLRAALKMAEEVKVQCNLSMAEITGGQVQTVTAVAAIKQWMAAQGVEVDSLNKQAVVDLLNEGSDDAVPDSLPPQVRKALLLRQEAGKASTAKFDVMLDIAGADGRLRNLYQFHGASTGRWGGRKVQPHNLPRDMPKAETVEKILALVRKGDWRAIDMIYGPPLTILSRCLRSFFWAPPGKQWISGDWSNVEGRGQAWFAGEDWKLRAFIAADNKTGPGLYELAYARMFGVPVESVKNPSEERQIGKVSELAFGYQGGLGSFYTMAKAYPDLKVQEMSDATIEGFKNAWRSAHPRITAVWREIQTAAISAVLSPGAAFSCGMPGRQATYKMVGSFLWCLLPSGRAICYPYPKILEGDFGPQLTYMCVPSQEDRKKKKIIHDKANAANWARVATYGGSLFNNIVQGFCRDFLADMLLWLDEMGAMIVMHTHDDVNIEVIPERAEGARAAMQEKMRTPPAWAVGFPLFSKPEILTRYGK